MLSTGQARRSYRQTGNWTCSLSTKYFSTTYFFDSFVRSFDKISFRRRVIVQVGQFVALMTKYFSTASFVGLTKLIFDEESSSQLDSLSIWWSDIGQSVMETLTNLHTNALDGTFWDANPELAIECVYFWPSTFRQHIVSTVSFIWQKWFSTQSSSQLDSLSNWWSGIGQIMETLMDLHTNVLSRRDPFECKSRTLWWFLFEIWQSTDDCSFDMKWSTMLYLETSSNQWGTYHRNQKVVSH